MFKIRSIIKPRILVLICTFLLCLSYSPTIFAAGEPGNGLYKIKSVSTGKYLTLINGEVSLSQTGTIFKVEDTEPSPSVKWFSITYEDKALSFTNKDATASFVDLIPGSLNYGQPNYHEYTCQRFNFGKTRSGYNIKSVAFGNNTDNRLLTIENGTLCLRKASGSKDQIFILEWQY